MEQYIRPKRKVKNTSAAAKITAKSEKSSAEGQIF